MTSGTCPGTVLVSTCSWRISAWQVRGCRGIQYRAARLGCTCGTAIYDLQLADFLCFFIRKLRLAYGVCSGFTRGEYHVARGDFIVALRRTKGRRRRTLRSPSPPSSGLHLLTPGNRCGGHDCCRGLIPILDSGIRCRSFIASSECCSAICVRAEVALVSVDFARHWVVRFSLLVGWTVRACGYVGVLPKSFVGFALTAVGSFVLVDTVMEYQIISSLSCTNAFLQ